jgi:hypothetical protein
VQAGAKAALDRVRIDGTTGSAFYVTTASTLTLHASTITGIAPHATGKWGDAVQVVAGSELRVDRTAFRGAHGAALVFAGGKGYVADSLVERNAVGIHVQDGSSISEANAAPESLDEGAVVITTTTRFVENATRVGTGVVPLPEPMPLD